MFARGSDFLLPGNHKSSNILKIYTSWRPRMSGAQGGTGKLAEKEHKAAGNSFEEHVGLREGGTSGKVFHTQRQRERKVTG